MAVKNQLAPVKKAEGLSAYLTKDVVKDQINRIVGGKESTRYISSIVSAVQTNPQLQECSNRSIVSASLLGHSLGLPPAPQLGYFYMVPFNNKKTGCKEAQFQLGYKGYIQLAKRSGVYRKINVLAIKEGELVSYDPLEEEISVTLIEDEDVRESAATIGYYAMFEELNGFRKSVYWSKKKMLSHADKYSQAFSRKSYEDLISGRVDQRDAWKYSSFWYKDFDAMAEKTLIKHLLSRWGTLSIELQNAINCDSAVIKDDMSPDYVEAANSADIDVVEQSDAEYIEVAEMDAGFDTRESMSDERSVDDLLFG